MAKLNMTFEDLAERLENAKYLFVPHGAIVLWSGSASDIPTGWALCDGTNGTPDLRNRFVVGAGGAYTVGNTGGADSITLSMAQMPSHTHEVSLSGLTASSAGAHTHTLLASNGTMGWSNSNRRIYQETPGSNYSSNQRTLDNGTESSGAHTHSITGSASIASTGGGGSHENRPPYYALCYIMKM